MVIEVMASDAVNASSSIPLPLPSSGPKTKRQILVVSADGAERARICDLLSQHGFGALASDIAEVDWLLDAYPINLVVVDLNLGAEPGLQLVTRLGLDFPVVVISDDRTCETDKVRGLECGADDYMSKPFGKREFVARIRVCLRPAKVVEWPVRMRAFSFAGWSLNTKSRILRHVSGEEVKLSAAEFSVLLTFLDNPQTILSREEIIAKTRLHDHEVVDRSIDVLILRLRRKIETGSDGAAMIQTVRGKGYVFVAPIRT
jgi:DNA-binding response OmpR family regulator